VLIRKNDYSYQGLSAGTVVKSEYIPVYDAGVLVFGREPGSASKSTSKDNGLSKATPTVKTESQPTAKHTQNPASDFKTPANQNSVKKRPRHKRRSGITVRKRECRCYVKQY